jgi:hypothetical protein
LVLKKCCLKKKAEGEMLFWKNEYTSDHARMIKKMFFGCWRKFFLWLLLKKNWRRSAVLKQQVYLKPCKVVKDNVFLVDTKTFSFFIVRKWSNYDEQMKDK